MEPISSPAQVRTKNLSCQTLCAPRVITATALKRITAARWSGLQLVLYLAPDLRRHCTGQITNSAVEFFAALGSSKIKQPNRNFHRKFLIFEVHIRIHSEADVQCASREGLIFAKYHTEQKGARNRGWNYAEAAVQRRLGCH